MKCSNMASSSTSLLVFSLLILGYAYATNEEPDDVDYTDLSYGVSDFSSKLLNEVALANRGKSVVISGLSVIYVLFMAYLGARGRTACEIIKSIGVTKKQAPDQFTALTDALANLEGVEFKMANKIYVKSGQQYELNADYQDDVIDTVDSEVESINFNQNRQAAKTINEWVANQTNDKIQNLLSPNDLDSSTRLVLINAIYFKGTWQKTFNEKATRPRTFFVNKQDTVQVPTMTMKARLPYAEDADLGCKVLKLDYAGGNASMVFFLPDDLEGIDALSDRLAKDRDAIYNALDKLKKVQVDISIPKFKSQTKTDLIALLEKLGINQIFDPKKSRLDCMLENPQPLHVSKMIQQAVIEVNEVGAEAAAATAAVIRTRAAIRGPRLPTFYASHAFLYGIITFDEVVLFSGVYDGK